MWLQQETVVQVLVAYALDPGAVGASVESRLERVEAHYRRLWPVPAHRSGADAAGLGLHVWDAVASPWRWPSWDREGDLAVATAYLPFGYERVIGDREPEVAALPLARALHQRPDAVLEMTGPFVLGSIATDSPELRLHTDALGIGRLFGARFDGGWVWSNRCVAVCRFAGIRAEPDRDGWRMHAAAEWFMRERSPIAGVSVVPAATVIRVQPNGLGPASTRTDPLGVWAGGTHDPLSGPHVDELAHALTGLVGSIGRMARSSVVADLSGGRDSRVVVAAAIAAGLTLEVQTSGAEPGEADVAEQLIAALPAHQARRITHRVTRPTVSGPARDFGLPEDAPILANALAWHRTQEALRPASYLPSVASATLPLRDRITMGGAGGEIAHGHYYPADYAQLGSIPWPARVDEIAERLAEKLYGASGASGPARLTTHAAIRATIEDAVRIGLADARALDHFYAAERLRRWGTAGETTGSVSPLLVPEFVRAAFALTPDHRRANALHRAVTARLTPEWHDVGYYRRPTGTVQPRLMPRLAAAVDRDAITAIVHDRDAWADAFEPGLVTRAWASMLDGRGGPADERLMQRVVWRAVFNDFLREVNDDPAERRPAVVSTSRPPGLVRRARRFAARALRRAARMAEPPA